MMGKVTLRQRPVERLSSIRPIDLVARFGAIGVLIVMTITFSIVAPDTFATKSNLINILDQSSLTAIVAMGLTYTLVTGQFDLSIGYSASLGAIITVWTMTHWGLSLGLAAATAVAVGILIGLANGMIVTRLRVNALVATLGTGTILYGICFVISRGLPISPPDPTSLINLTLGDLFGVPYPVYVLAIAAILAWIILNRTELGLAMQAVGGNPEAARLSGIHLNRTIIFSFVVAGICAAGTGVLLAGLAGSATVDGGVGYLLPAFSAAFFGSAVLRDGQFHIVGTLLGVLTVQVGFTGLAILGYATYYQYLFQGALLIFAVGIGTYARARSERGRISRFPTEPGEDAGGPENERRTHHESSSVSRGQ